nr:unnamed protein product [Digitaria exilis]
MARSREACSVRGGFHSAMQQRLCSAHAKGQRHRNESGMDIFRPSDQPKALEILSHDLTGHRRRRSTRKQLLLQSTSRLQLSAALPCIHPFRDGYREKRPAAVSFYRPAMRPPATTPRWRRPTLAPFSPQPPRNLSSSSSAMAITAATAEEPLELVVGRGHHRRRMRPLRAGMERGTTRPTGGRGSRGERAQRESTNRPQIHEIPNQIKHKSTIRSTNRLEAQIEAQIDSRITNRGGRESFYTHRKGREEAPPPDLASSMASQAARRARGRARRRHGNATQEEEGGWRRQRGLELPLAQEEAAFLAQARAASSRRRHRSCPGEAAWGVREVSREVSGGPEYDVSCTQYALTCLKLKLPLHPASLLASTHPTLQGADAAGPGRPPTQRIRARRRRISPARLECSPLAAVVAGVSEERPYTVHAPFRLQGLADTHAEYVDVPIPPCLAYPTPLPRLGSNCPLVPCQNRRRAEKQDERPLSTDIPCAFDASGQYRAHLLHSQQQQQQLLQLPLALLHGSVPGCVQRQSVAFVLGKDTIYTHHSALQRLIGVARAKGCHAITVFPSLLPCCLPGDAVQKDALFPCLQHFDNILCTNPPARPQSAAAVLTGASSPILAAAAPTATATFAAWLGPSRDGCSVQADCAFCPVQRLIGASPAVAASPQRETFPGKESPFRAARREEKDDGTKEVEPTLSRVAAEEREARPTSWLVDCYLVKNGENRIAEAATVYTEYVREETAWTSAQGRRRPPMSHACISPARAPPLEMWRYTQLNLMVAPPSRLACRWSPPANTVDMGPSSRSLVMEGAMGLTSFFQFRQGSVATSFYPVSPNPCNWLAHSRERQLSSLFKVSKWLLLYSSISPFLPVVNEHSGYGVAVGTTRVLPFHYFPLEQRSTASRVPRNAAICHPRRAPAQFPAAVLLASPPQSEGDPYPRLDGGKALRQPTGWPVALPRASPPPRTGLLISDLLPLETWKFSSTQSLRTVSSCWLAKSRRSLSPSAPNLPLVLQQPPALPAHWSVLPSATKVEEMLRRRQPPKRLVTWRSRSMALNRSDVDHEWDERRSVDAAAAGPCDYRFIPRGSFKPLAVATTDPMPVQYSETETSIHHACPLRQDMPMATPFHIGKCAYNNGVALDLQ